MIRKLPTKTESEVHYILPKSRFQVVVKEDDKILCHKNASISTLNRIAFIPECIIMVTPNCNGIYFE